MDRSKPKTEDIDEDYWSMIDRRHGVQLAASIMDNLLGTSHS
jgi:hypothetical protein